jgi:hypothetical protein
MRDSQLYRVLDKVLIDREVLSSSEIAELLSDIDGVDYNAQWDLYAGKRRTGMNLLGIGMATATLSGGVYIVSGLVTGIGALGTALGPADDKYEVLDNLNTSHAYISNLCAIGAIVGVTVAATGLTMALAYAIEMNEICNLYNSSSAKLSFGPTSGGLGLALSF